MKIRGATGIATIEAVEIWGERCVFEASMTQEPVSYKKEGSTDGNQKRRHDFIIRKTDQASTRVSRATLTRDSPSAHPGRAI